MSGAEAEVQATIQRPAPVQSLGYHPHADINAIKFEEDTTTPMNTVRVPSSHSSMRRGTCPSYYVGRLDPHFTTPATETPTDTSGPAPPEGNTPSEDVAPQLQP